MKHTLLIVGSVLLIVAVLVGLRLLSAEDTWLCRDGQRVRHGSPTTDMPTEPCPTTLPTPTSTPIRTILLYYYDSSRDTDEAGNILCSAQGLVPVSREIPLTTTPIQDAVRELLKGRLTANERTRGITTEYPLPGLELEAASLNSGVLTLTFVDPQNKSGGGSCRVGILWAQIRATAMQFDGVIEVRFMPEELFQP